MKFVLFYHSLVSDWNHGNAHFLRGVVRELSARGHEVEVYEPSDGWSRSNLLREPGGRDAVQEFPRRFPGLRSQLYDLGALNLDRVLDGADVVVVHEWNAPELVAMLGRHRGRGGAYRLLFHDTHHRSASAPEAIDGFQLDGFDGVLAFGEAVRERYLRCGWARQVWTWHEAADTALFRPLERRPHDDVVWIGNWGDGERSAELETFLAAPLRRLGLSAAVHGVRYPAEALAALAQAGIHYRGWLPNHRVPEIFAAARLTVHVPRRPYAAALPGIPTIRVFEALACGIPLISAPWDDAENLFGDADFLLVADGDAMAAGIRSLMHDADMAGELARNGLGRIRARHSCSHRADELLAICGHLGLESSALNRDTRIAECA